MSRGDTSSLTETKQYRGLTSRLLPNLILDSEAPIQTTRSLPAQTLYLAIQTRGVSASSDLIELASVEQCRLMLDFDIWDRDTFSPDRFFDWLRLPEDTDGHLEILQKILHSVDLKIVALMIDYYVESVNLEHPTDTPPGEGFATPDKGMTWINIHSLDPEKQFLLNRFLALLFETDADLFYQLLAFRLSWTRSLLEEEGLQDKIKRLSIEGIPDSEYSAEITSPLNPALVNSLLSTSGRNETISDIHGIEPLLYDKVLLQPFTKFFAESPSRDDACSEFTLILNASVVKWNVSFADCDEMEKIISFVKGAVNIAIEELSAKQKLSFKELHDKIGLQRLFQIGLFMLFDIRKAALKITKDQIAPTSPEMIVVESASRQLPEIPLLLSNDGKFLVDEADSKRYPSGSRSIEHAVELKAIQIILDKLTKK